MMSIVWTLRLLLAAVAVMASVPGSAGAGKPGPGSRTGISGSTVTRFACAHCTATGLLSSRGLFHSLAAVRRHIGHAKACRAANLGIQKMDDSMYQYIWSCNSFLLCCHCVVQANSKNSSGCVQLDINLLKPSRVEFLQDKAPLLSVPDRDASSPKWLESL